MNKKQEPIASFHDPALDEVLVIAAKTGDERAFEILVERHQRRILALAFYYTRVRQDAEDVVQESFQKAFFHIDRFEGKSSFSTWLTRIAINEALMFLRRRRGRGDVWINDAQNAEGTTSSLDIPDSCPDPETSYLQRERAQILAAAIDKLRPTLRTAIELRELSELSTEETARRMGLSIVAVKGRLIHGRRKLRETLSPYLKTARMSGRDMLVIANNGSRSSQDRLTCNA